MGIDQELLKVYPSCGICANADRTIMNNFT